MGEWKRTRKKERERENKKRVRKRDRERERERRHVCAFIPYASQSAVFNSLC